MVYSENSECLWAVDKVEDSEAVQTGMLGTWSECFSHAFEKPGQFGIENNTIIKWEIQKFFRTYDLFPKINRFLTIL